MENCYMNGSKTITIFNERGPKKSKRFKKLVSKYKYSIFSCKYELYEGTGIFFSYITTSNTNECKKTNKYKLRHKCKKQLKKFDKIYKRYKRLLKPRHIISMDIYRRILDKVIDAYLIKIFGLKVNLFDLLYCLQYINSKEVYLKKYSLNDSYLILSNSYDKAVIGNYL